jgi:DNA-directed RNA polymerase omega subunit
MTTQNNRESMRYPSVDQLTEMTTSKYKLVIAAANRAKEIELEEKTFMEHPVNKKSIGLALEEIYTGKVIIK